MLIPLPAPVAVAPFFRASVIIGGPERRLFERRLDAAAFDEAIRRSDTILRQNLRRLFAAALLAQARGGYLVLAEGWRSNAVRKAPRARFVTGSWCLGVFLRLLRRRRLVPGGRVIRRDVSRCTWEEARAILEIAGRDAEVVGVSDVPCPSAARAARYLRGGRVITPAEALASVSTAWSGEQRGFWSALQPRGSEVWRGPVLEAPNWILHAVSEVASGWVGLDPPLEARLARALRPDHSARAIASTASGFSTDARSPTGSPR